MLVGEEGEESDPEGCCGALSTRCPGLRLVRGLPARSAPSGSLVSLYQTRAARPAHGLRRREAGDAGPPAERPIPPSSYRVLAPSSWCLRASQPRVALGPRSACDLAWPWDRARPGTPLGTRSSLSRMSFPPPLWMLEIALLFSLNLTLPSGLGRFSRWADLDSVTSVHQRFKGFREPPS